VTSYLLSSSFVPVLSVWLLQHQHAAPAGTPGWFSFERFRRMYAAGLHRILPLRWILLGVYLAVALGLVGWWFLLNHPGVGTEIFPKVDAGQFQLRLRAPTGTRIERTEALTLEALRAINKAVGPDNVSITVAYVGVPSPNYPINNVYLWT